MSRVSILLTALCLVLSGCGRSAPAPTPPSPPVGVLLSNMEQEVRSKTQWRDGVPVWVDGAGQVEQGNSWLFGGLLCVAGESQVCDALESSFRGHSRPCRAPWRYTADGCAEGPDTFSRDEVLGMLLVASTHENNITTRGWLRASHEGGLSFRYCPDATDSRCHTTPQLLGLTARVLDIPGSPWALTDDTGISTAAATAPAGFQLHLVGVQLLLRQRIGQYNNTLHLAAKHLYSRQPKNPFFAYLAGEFDAARKLTLEAWECRKASTLPPKDWFTQRDTTERACERDSYHTFLFLHGLLK